MKFRRFRGKDEPEINFIPLIDLLLVILIFLMVTTTYSRFNEMQTDLPTAAAGPVSQIDNLIKVVVTKTGEIKIGDELIADQSMIKMVDVFKRSAIGKRQPIVVINADAKALHQSVITVMDAARKAGLTQLTFATQILSQ